MIPESWNLILSRKIIPNPFSFPRDKKSWNGLSKSSMLLQKYASVHDVYKTRVFINQTALSYQNTGRWSIVDPTTGWALLRGFPVYLYYIILS